MKRIIFILSIVLLSALPLSAQKPSVSAYPNGIHVFCGTEIPRNFYYLVEKKDATGQWVAVAELRAPKNAAALKANLMNLPSYFRTTMPLPIELSDYLWERQSLSAYTDSLSVFSTDSKIVSALGCGWFDDGLTAEGDRHYRISRVTGVGAMILGEFSQHFPENSYQGTLTALRFTPSPEAGVITIYYALSDPKSTYHVKLYRSRLQENSFHEVSCETSYTSIDDRVVAVIRDETVTKGMAYSYIAVPCDFLGNQGTPADVLNIYNMSNMSDIGILSDFTAVADKDKKGVMLTWTMTSNYYIMGYEIFRSRDYDGVYNRIATLPADVTSYLDDVDIDPGEAYFYYMTVNNGYGNNVPSARTPVILEGVKENFLPPQNVEAILRGNVVQLLFHSIEPDTRGYQIFRGEGYTGELTQIAAISVSAEEALSVATEGSLVVFNDTLELTARPRTLSYAVADVNSSYSISPLSERVSIQFSGGMLPAPMISEAQFRDDRIYIVWDDVSKQNAYVSGYNVLRSTVGDGGVEGEPQIVATLPYIENFYTDTLFTPGTHYRYAIESVDINGEKSGQSLNAGVVVPQKFPLPPGQLSAIASTDRILLRWDTPLDPTLKAIRVYRATLNNQAALLRELPPNQSAFEDQTAKKGEQYFYYVVTVNERGLESRADEPVSGRVR